MDLDQAELNGLCERAPQGSDDYEQVKPPSEYECHAVPSAGTLRDKQWQSAPDKYGSLPTQRLTHRVFWVVRVTLPQLENQG